jgi:hypothetical protein
MITVTVTGIDEIVVNLDNASRSITRAAARAMNRGILSGQTVMVKAIAADTGMRQKDVRDALVLKEANVNRLEASLAASLKRIALVDFDAKGSEPSRGKGRGVSYRLQGSRSRVATAFIATMASGHRGVFTRRGKARLGIRELFGPSLGRVFNKYREPAEQRAVEMFQKNFGHELEVETNGFFQASQGEQGVSADA